MEANELMIGDWVLDGDEVARVTSLTCDDIIETTLRLSNIEIVTPIPLTAEILEKNGFERSYSNILTADGYKKLPQYKYKNMVQVQDICRNLITISYSDLEGGVYDIQCGIGSHIYDLKYVHQLQHALRLCGIDKDIVL